MDLYFFFWYKETWPHIFSNDDCFIFKKINPETKFNDFQHKPFLSFFFLLLIFFIVLSFA